MLCHQEFNVIHFLLLFASIINLIKNFAVTFYKLFVYQDINIIHKVCETNSQFIENMLYTLHATYIKHNFYADFSLKLKKLFKEFFYDKFTVQDEWNLSLLRFWQFTF